MNQSNKPSLLVVGVHQSTDAYPNTRYRVRDLREKSAADEINEPLWTTPTGGWGGVGSMLRMLLRAITSHLRVARKILGAGKYDVAYIPYPAPTVMLLLSMLPRRFRPGRVLLDGFISIYDTLVNDRKIWRHDGLRSRLLHALERKAFADADAVLVDTPENAEFYSSIFGLPRAGFVPVPLATNETDFVYEPYHPGTGRCRVLFIGTLVPLHGIETIVEAARLLEAHVDIEFRILGDGADAPKIEEGVAGLENVAWQRRWHSTEELKQEIAAADICLGIFGDTDKAQRVCPYKLYAYASVGRAIITGDTEWLRNGGDDAGKAFMAVPVANAAALAASIRSLAGSSAARSAYALNAHDFYRRKLSNEIAWEGLQECIRGTSY